MSNQHLLRDAQRLLNRCSIVDNRDSIVNNIYIKIFNCSTTIAQSLLNRCSIDFQRRSTRWLFDDHSILSEMTFRLLNDIKITRFNRTISLFMSASLSSFWLNFLLYIIIFSICWKRSISWFFHVMKHSFMILVSFLFIKISYVKRFVNSSKYLVVFEYNSMSLIIELFRAMIMTINIFIWFNEILMIAINLLRVRDFESEFKVINKLNE